MIVLTCTTIMSSGVIVTTAHSPSSSSEPLCRWPASYTVLGSFSLVDVNMAFHL